MRTPDFHGNVVVSNLPKGFTAGELAALFDDFGLVLGAEMDRRRAFQGSLILAPEAAVDKAIEAMNGLPVAGYALKVTRAPAVPKREKPASSSHRAVEAVPRFSSISASSISDEVPVVPRPASARQVIVEYRKTRRIEIPSGTPMSGFR